MALAQKPGHGETIAYQKYSEKSPDKQINFAVKGKADLLRKDQRITYKYEYQDWIYVRSSSRIISQLIQEGIVSQIYFTPSRPALLNDTMRIVQNVDSVHNGEWPLPSSYTGKDVVIGYIDTGLDFNHGDFKNPDGSTRVLYYWDQTQPFDALTTPPKYGYGQVCDSATINSAACGSLDNHAHGTTVTGTGSGNGLATGSFKGVAPESDIIIVESDFASPNWTLTVADGIDFVFSMADTLGKPAVVNTSVGDYLGSHDGTDPASQIIDSLLNDLPGRIVVAAAGNSGFQGKYHVNATVSSDTSFCWFEVNPASAFGGDAVFFDLWADTADFNAVQFAIGADNSAPFDFRGRTAFYNILPILGTTIYDSIMVAGNKLAHVAFTTEEINGVYHLEVLLDDPDSNMYLYRFETFGAGEYDLWSGEFLDLSNIKSTGLPDVISFPDIAYYNMPDTLSTIVSSWTCLPSVVTVGNFQNQWDYIDYNGDPYSSGVVPGILSKNSSKGPNRMGVIKPDVSATGDLILSACPLWLSPSLIATNPGMMAPGGMHVRNGGTSMASPVIAGIAALYLEKCPTSTYQDFLDDLHLLAHEDGFTGPTPNMGYGFGKVDAFELLNHTNFDVTVNGDSILCSDPEIYTAETGPFASYDWSTSETSATITLTAEDVVYVTVTNDQGCSSYSDTIVVVQGEIPTFPIINEIGGGLITVAADSFIWYFDGMPISGSNSQYFDPDTTGTYTVEVFSEDGCSLTSDSKFVDYSQIVELTKNEFVILPNPFDDQFSIIKSDFFDVEVVLTDIQGKVVYHYSDFESDDLFITIELPYLPSGVYVLGLHYEDYYRSFKLVKR